MSTERPASSVPRRVLFIVLKLSVSVVLLGIVLSRVDLNSMWEGAKGASPAWIAVALAIYGVSFVAATWRWHLLLGAQNVRMPRLLLFKSYLVAAFFNNFLPSNIGGDVVRIRDTAPSAGSKTLATTVVLVDRVLGLMGLILVAAMGATLAATAKAQAPSPIWPSWLWAGFLLGVAALAPAVLAPAGFGRLLRPLAVLHPTWIGDRIETFTDALARFRQRPGVLASCFTGAVFVQGLLVVYYLAVVHALDIPVTIWDLAVIVPVSFVVQLVPISVNGFGLREATFSLYFSRLHLPIHSAVLMSLMATGLMMLFSLTGAAVYASRGGRPSPVVPGVA
jgi:uncharacterized membrane protein YbhN (UPF0104 family)